MNPADATATTTPEATVKIVSAVIIFHPVRQDMNRILSLLLGLVSERLLLSVLADTLIALRPAVKGTTTPIDDAILEALIKALQERAKGA